MLADVVPILIYVVVGSCRAVGALLLITLLSWWFFCDYFFSPAWWSPVWEHAGFMLFPAAWIIAAGILEWVRLRTTWSRLGARLSLVHEDDSFPASAWARMVAAVAGHPIGNSRRFLEWQSRKIGSLPSDRRIIAGRIRCVWWTEWRLALGLVAVLWLPGLCAALIAAPLLTPVMEVVAHGLSKEPQKIFAVEFIGRDPATNRLIREPLWTRPGGFMRVGISSHVASGRFVVSSTRFPRVYRTLAASCTLECQLDDPALPSPVLGLSTPVRAGAAAIGWFQTTPEPRLILVLRLRSADGAYLDEQVIEPE